MPQNCELRYYTTMLLIHIKKEQNNHHWPPVAECGQTLYAILDSYDEDWCNLHEAIALPNNNGRAICINCVRKITPLDLLNATEL